MKCLGCGHDYPSTLTRCTKCGRQNPRRTRALADSRLLEFPRQPRSPVEKTESESALPAWRLELSEKVRQVKARRNGEIASAAPSRDIPPRSETRTVEPASVGPVNGARGSRPASDGNTPIVEAALSRVRRANRDALSSSHATAAHASAAKTSLGLDKEATARALDTAEDPREMPVSQTVPLPEQEYHSSGGRTGAVAAKTAPQFSNQTEARSYAKPDIPATVGTAAAQVGEWKLDRSFEGEHDGPIEEIDPLDYLEAEIKKVDRELARDRSEFESAPLSSRVISGFIDLIVIGLSSMPFIALIEIANGNFAARGTRITVAAVVLLISFFYLFLTQTLSSRTFGMMLTNTRVVELHTRQPLTARRAFIRLLGYVVALAPAAIGMAWAIADHRNRGLHDLISGTVVVRDY
jgi:uncharacterized RDD family membrane protein YckC